MRLEVEKTARQKRAMQNGTTISKKESHGRIIKTHTQGKYERSYHATKGWRVRRVPQGDFEWPWLLSSCLRPKASPAEPLKSLYP